MADRDEPLAWIDTELVRLGCKEILLVLAEPEGQIMFVWRAEPFTCRADEARRALGPLHRHAGDQKVWEALEATSAALT